MSSFIARLCGTDKILHLTRDTGLALLNYSGDAYYCEEEGEIYHKNYLEWDAYKHLDKIREERRYIAGNLLSAMIANPKYKEMQEEEIVTKAVEITDMLLKKTNISNREESLKYAKSLLMD